MKKTFVSTLLLIVISLGVVGLGISLFQETGRTLQTIATFILIAGITFGVFHWYNQSKKNTDTKKYEQALRKNKKKVQTSYAQKKPSYSKEAQHQKNILPLRKSKKANHLYVIDGKKSKKKA